MVFQPGSTTSLHKVALLPVACCAWTICVLPMRMAEGGLEAVRADEDVVAASCVRELGAKVRELERLLGRKKMEAEILREALEPAVRHCLTAVKSPTP